MWTVRIYGYDADGMVLLEEHDFMQEHEARELAASITPETYGNVTVEVVSQEHTS